MEFGVPLPEKMRPELLSSSFDQVLPIWEKHLWPGRQSLIEPISYVSRTGDIDMTIGQLSYPQFFEYRLQGKLIGATSLAETEPQIYRLRGTWISPEVRGQGLGKEFVLKSLQKMMESQSVRLFWTMARSSNLGFYQSCGFQAVREVSQYEFGPHIIMEAN